MSLIDIRGAPELRKQTSGGIFSIKRDMAVLDVRASSLGKVGKYVLGHRWRSPAWSTAKEYKEKHSYHPVTT